MSKRTLLLADDSVTIQKVVNLTFADEGIDVVTVGDGDTAMQKIYEIGPDVVLADVHMPGLNGYQICEILRENPATFRVPVVLLVGSFEPFDESEAARVGANAYLTKPFQSIRQLVTQVTDLISSASPEPAQPEPAQTEVAQSETAPVAQASPGKAPDTTDIDSLYHQSFGDPGKSNVETSTSYAAEAPSEEPSFGSADHGYSEDHSEAPATTSPYVDAGMDDEMIETSHVAGAGYSDESPETGWSSSAHEAEPKSPENASEASWTTSSYEAELQSADSGLTASDQDYTPEPQYSSGMNAGAEQAAYNETPETDWVRQENQTSDRGAFDSYAEDRTEYPSEPAGTTDSADDFDEFSRTEQMPASITASSFHLDDLNILDLPPLETGNTQEFSTAPRPESEGGGKEIVSLSPELMDQLVQRVIEKLSKEK